MDLPLFFFLVVVCPKVPPCCRFRQVLCASTAQDGALVVERLGIEFSQQTISPITNPNKLLQIERKQAVEVWAAARRMQINVRQIHRLNQPSQIVNVRPRPEFGKGNGHIPVVCVWTAGMRRVRVQNVDGGAGWVERAGEYVVEDGF